MLPGFIDGFNWSIPFIIEKVVNMTYHLLYKNIGDSADDIESSPEYAQLVKQQSLRPGTTMVPEQASMVN